MKLRIVISLCVVFACACDAHAGPVRNRLKARSAAPCQPCGASVASTPATLPAVQPAIALPTSANSCAGGTCPTPMRDRLRLFR